MIPAYVAVFVIGAVFFGSALVRSFKSGKSSGGSPGAPARKDPSITVTNQISEDPAIVAAISAALGEYRTKTLS